MHESCGCPTKIEHAQGPVSLTSVQHRACCRRGQEPLDRAQETLSELAGARSHLSTVRTARLAFSLRTVPKPESAHRDVWENRSASFASRL